MFNWIKRKWRAFKRYISRDQVIVNDPDPVIDLTPITSPSVEGEDLTERQARLLKLWKSMRPGYLKGQSASAVTWYIKKAKSGMGAYQSVERITGVPWQVVAVVHALEASFDWNDNLMNGQPWNKKTTWVPKGHGPWTSWEKAAVAAFELKKKEGKLPKTWGLGETLEFLLKFNGLGYEGRGLVSPYLWSFTNHYQSQGGGKYVKDGEFSRSAISKQVGAAVILKELGYGE